MSSHLDAIMEAALASSTAASETNGSRENNGTNAWETSKNVAQTQAGHPLQGGPQERKVLCTLCYLYYTRKNIYLHFCGEPEESATFWWDLYLATCPVYSDIMKGTEFLDIKSENIRKVKTALANIRSALTKRSKALSLTSMAPVTIENMLLEFNNGISN